MAYKIYGWACRTPGCPSQGKLKIARLKGPKPVGQWIYRAVVCKACKRPCTATGQQWTKYTLADLL